ncbi:hypothetical protein ACFLZ2_04580 [Candidatus Margulisiibacteriota bacterium]
MDLKDELNIERYRAELKERDHCRTSERTMLNFSLIIFGAIIWFIFTQLDGDLYKFSASLFLAIIIGLIGLFIARLNEIEQVYVQSLNIFYEEQGLKQYSYAIRRGFNRWITLITFLLLVLVALILLVSFSGPYKICAGIFAAIFFFVYAYIFKTTMILNNVRGNIKEI